MDRAATVFACRSSQEWDWAPDPTVGTRTHTNTHWVSSAFTTTHTHTEQMGSNKSNITAPFAPCFQPNGTEVHQRDIEAAALASFTRTPHTWSLQTLPWDLSPPNIHTQSLSPPYPATGLCLGSFRCWFPCQLTQLLVCQWVLLVQFGHTVDRCSTWL